MTSVEAQTILITGGTGFVGSHAISVLLQEGYRIRATARPGKADQLLSAYPDARPGFLVVVEVTDLTAGHSKALEGVDILLHIASPIYGRGQSNADLAKGAYEGSISIINQAVAAGIKKIITTSSFAAVFSADLHEGYEASTITKENFGASTLSSLDIEHAPPITIYVVAKTDAERSFWQLAEEHKDIDFTSINPSVIFGPYPHYYKVTEATLGTNSYFYELLKGTYPQLPSGHLVDVRDVVKAYVKALKVPPLPERKRFLVYGSKFSLERVVQVLRENRPDLSDRLPPPGAKQPIPAMTAPFDLSFTEEHLGLKSNDYVRFVQTVLDVFDDLLAWEREKDSI